MSRWIDYWCNAFTPDKRAHWDAAIEAQGLEIRIRRRDDDSFAEVDTMVERMDELDIASLVLPCGQAPVGADSSTFELFATGFDDIEKWSQSHPGRFAGLYTLDPTSGIDGVRRAEEALAKSYFVGLHIHTHSWDREFDDRDYYPYYALAAEYDVPVVMQAGTSGGRTASACGKPIGIDRPALFFEDVRFVLSHTGWPWVDEALAMVSKHRHVYLGTAAYPPHHWSDALVRFIDGAGRGQVMFGTSFPVVGHRHALTRLADIPLSDEARSGLLEETARRVFTRLAL